METKNPGFITNSVAAVGARNGPGTVPIPSPISDKSKEDSDLIKKALSLERFESHRKAPNESDAAVFARYQWNVAICEHFYAPLLILEVVLRNQFNEAIAARTNDPHWLTKAPQWLREDERKDIINAHDYLQARKRPITQARIVQEMSFGFWTSLLNSRYETLFHGIGAQVFPGMLRSERTRANASQRFEYIRALRNRIFHFRRIWNRPDLKKDHAEILETIEWVNTDARRLLLPSDAVSRFLECMAKAPL